MVKFFVLLFSTIVFFVIIGKSKSEVNKNENLKFFLTKYELTEIVNINNPPFKLKNSKVEGSIRNFEITVFGNKFVIDLLVFFPREDSQIDYISKTINATNTYFGYRNLLYYGYVRNVKNSFVLGYFSKGKSFKGYVITDEVFCIEPYEANEVIIYRFNDVIFPGCVKKSEDGDIDCSESRYFVPWNAKRAQPIELFLPKYDLLYDKFLKFYSRHQAKKASSLQAKENDGHKNNSSTSKHHGNETKDHDKSDKKSKTDKHHHNETNDHHKDKTGKHHGNESEDHHKSNKNITSKKESGKKSEIKVSGEYYGMNEVSNSGSKTKDFKTTGLNEKSKDRQYITQYINNAKYKSKHQKKDIDDDGGSDDHDDDDDDDKEDSGDKILKDNDRFPVIVNNIDYLNNVEDTIKTFRESSRLDANDLKNTMIQFYKSKDPLKNKSVEVTENYQKQAIKRELKSRYVEPIAEELKIHAIETLQCNVKAVVAPSLMKKFNDDTEAVVKDILIQFTLLNSILLKLPLERNGQHVHFDFHIDQIVLLGDRVYSPFTGRADIDYFTKSNRGEHFCLIIGLVNQHLKSGDYFDGYTPEGKGGICSKDGNTAIVSHGNENTPAPMAVYFASLMRAVTRAMGATDKDDTCMEGSYPNPLKVIQDYILAPEIFPSPGNAVFSSCNIKEIEHVLSRRSCFNRVSQPLCGNAILDPGEECDCGPSILCDKIDPCCNMPNLFLEPKASKGKSGSSAHRSCTLVKGAQCSYHQQCCSSCSITKNDYCTSGPFDCDISMCDGKSASCPSGAEASNGMVCFANQTLMEPLVCKDNKCDQPLCSSFNLDPCSCTRGTPRECVYCCMKDGLCQAAGSELKLFPGRNFNLPDDTVCIGGSCQQGKCMTFNGEQQLYNKTLKKPFPETSHAHNEFSTLHHVVVNVFSASVLFYLQYFIWNV